MGTSEVQEGHVDKEEVFVLRMLTKGQKLMLQLRSRPRDQGIYIGLITKQHLFRTVRIQ